MVYKNIWRFFVNIQQREIDLMENKYFKFNENDKNKIKNILKNNKNKNIKLLNKIKLKINKSTVDDNAETIINELFNMMIKEYPILDKTEKYELDENTFDGLGDLSYAIENWIINYDSYDERPMYDLNSIGHADENHKRNYEWLDHLFEISKYRINISKELEILNGKPKDDIYQNLIELEPILNQIGLSIIVYTHNYWRRGTRV